MPHSYGSPKDRLRHIFLKLDRAVAHVHDLEVKLAATARTKPYAVRVKRDTDNGVPVGRLVFVKKSFGWSPDPSLSLLAGEALYHLRSVLDQSINHLIVSNRKTNKITTKTQFPIFRWATKYRSDAGRQIDVIPAAIGRIIEGHQPYNRSAFSPENDPLWILHMLNNTDKHRRLNTTANGISVVRVHDSKGLIGTIQSPDITVKHNHVFFTLLLPTDTYDEIKADLSLAIAFKEFMSPISVTMPMDHLLWTIVGRVQEILGSIGLRRPA